MPASQPRIVRALRILLLALGVWLAHEAPASAQFGYGGMGYGGMGYGGMGYGGMGFGGMGYGGFGGMGYGGFGGGYGGFGGGYGGFGGGYGGYGGFGYGNNFGLGGSGFISQYPNYALGGVGFPGTSWQNPYFSFGLSPLAVQNAVFERTVLGRTTPPLQSSQVARPQPVAGPVPPSGQVGMGTFSNPR